MGTGEYLTHFNNKINKHKWKAAAPHGRLPHTKHKQKIQAWSSLVFHCCHSSFNPFEAPPWDSRPVSGAGVVHYQLLHRPRSVPTALGPAPLVTHMLFLTDCLQGYLPKHAFWCSFVCIYSSMHKKSGGELSIHAELMRLSVCALFICVCAPAWESSHTVRDCYSNNPESFICSPCVFRQSLYRVLICEIERECTCWRECIDGH